MPATPVTNLGLFHDGQYHKYEAWTHPAHPGKIFYSPYWGEQPAWGENHDIVFDATPEVFYANFYPVGGAA